MQVHHFSPYSNSKNLGKELNRCAELVQDPDAWLCFRDMDTMFLTPDAGAIIEQNVKSHPEVSLFSCMTNRVGYLGQCYKSEISSNTDILHHYEIACDLAEHRRFEIKYDSSGISGLLMLIQKRTWTEIGGAKDGLLGVDRDIFRKVEAAGRTIAIMQGLYLFHFYRLNKNRKDTSHLTPCTPQLD